MANKRGKNRIPKLGLGIFPAQFSTSFIANTPVLLSNIVNSDEADPSGLDIDEFQLFVGCPGT